MSYFHRLQRLLGEEAMWCCGRAVSAQCPQRLGQCSCQHDALFASFYVGSFPHYPSAIAPGVVGVTLPSVFL
jgi:hypothetical protein